MPDMDEQTIKVLARFTEVGQWWPVGAWIYFPSMGSDWDNMKWWKIEEIDSHRSRVRLDYEISELEANQKGIYRTNNAEI